MLCVVVRCWSFVVWVLLLFGDRCYCFRRVLFALCKLLFVLLLLVDDVCCLVCVD